MNLNLRNLKGTADFMPQEQRMRQGITRSLQKVFELYGYQPVETPIICFYDVLSSKYAGGAEILKEVYTLSDQGGRDLGLRYDLTVPFAKLIGMNPDLRMPFKRYEIGKVFRDGPVKTGRCREFIQCDVDMVGVISIMAEAELMMLASEVFHSLGLDVLIYYNNRKLLSGVIEWIGIERDLAGSVILGLDKWDKIGECCIREELNALGIDNNQEQLLVDYMKKQPEEILDAFNESESSELIRTGLKELEELGAYMEALNIKKNTQFKPGLARGLEIYTGTVWEVFLRDGSINSSVGAGGRYDTIIGSFLDDGMEYPAVGMTFGLDVIYEALLMKGANLKKPPVDFYVIPMGTEMVCMKLITTLREMGISADIEMSGRKLKRSLEYVNKRDIPYALILGENELRDGMVRFKDMRKGEEALLLIDELSQFILNLLK